MAKDAGTSLSDVSAYLENTANDIGLIIIFHIHIFEFIAKSAAAPEVPEIPVAGPNENGRWHVTIGSGKSAVPVAPAEPEPLADAGSDGRWYVSIGSGCKLFARYDVHIE